MGDRNSLVCESLSADLPVKLLVVKKRKKRMKLRFCPISIHSSAR